MVSVRVDYFFRQCDLFYLRLQVIKHFSQRPPIRYSSKLFIALSLQVRDAVVSQSVRAMMLCVCGAGISAASTQTEFSFIKNSYNLVNRYDTILTNHNEELRHNFER